MATFFTEFGHAFYHERYLQGQYQEVYDELVALGKYVFEQPVYDDALAVAQEMMRRIRANIGLIIARLHDMRYNFGEGFSESAEEAAYWEANAPIYQPPTQETAEHVRQVEALAGTLPLSLKCFYEEVGSVNLVGTFPISERKRDRISYGSSLDPLFVYSVKMALTIGNVIWDKETNIYIAPDLNFKYLFSGSGPYQIRVPCKAFDASLLYEPHETTLVNYLRTCFHWGGFPGLEHDNRLSQAGIDFLTADLLAF